MAKKEPQPNYELMFQNAVTGLQIAYSEYKKTICEAIRWTFIDSDGRMAILGGYEDRQKRIEEAESEVIRLMKLVNELRVKAR